MAKTIQDAAITTPNARSRLQGEGPHWREVATGVHVGYRRKKRGGSWVARWYLGNGKYRQKPLGGADDEGVKADGLRVLSFEQAKRETARVASEGYADAKAAENGPVPTVRSAVEAYAKLRDNRTREHKQRADIVSDFTLRMRRHVLDSDLAGVELHKLTAEHLKSWIEGMPATLAPSSVHRTAKDLKAALNASGKAESAMVRRGLELKSAVRPVVIKKADDEEGEFKDIEAQILTDDEVRQIIESAHEIDTERGDDGDLHRMVLLLAATGMRLSQLARMRVADVDAVSGVLYVPFSRKGKNAEDREDSREPRLVAPSVIDALRPVLDRPRGAILLTIRKAERNGTQWQRTDERGPWQSQTISKPWKRIRNRAGLSEIITPYALRHSSICRMIMQHVPAMLVAKRHNTSVEIIERHYARALSRANPERAEDVFKVAA